MIFAVVSDIHANLDAFQAVVDQMNRNYQVDKVLCLGDIVGYGAEPNPCVERVIELCANPPSEPTLLVKGNHDDAAVTGNVRNFNRYASAAALWTREILTGHNANFLSNLPLTASFDEVLLAHGTPYEPDKWHYVFDRKAAWLCFKNLPEPTTLCFIGHTHVPVVFVQDSAGGLQMFDDCEFDLEPGNKYLINVGSVGQPRDYDPRACYCIYDSELKTIKLNKVNYPVENAQNKIIDAGLPDQLAARLAIGQ